MELLLFALVGGAALLTLYQGEKSRWGLALVVLLLGAAAGFAWSRRAPVAGSEEDPYTARRPLEVREDGFVSSKVCGSCHPSQYASWHASYHRTMTQVVTPATMLAEWDGARLEWRGNDYELERVGDEFWLESVDGEQRTRSRAVVSTGSHNQQVYWCSVGRGREIQLLPFTWLVAERRWIPYEWSFLGAPYYTSYRPEVWNTNCLKCHSTAYSPRLDPATGVPDTHIGEFGIACESCHGPGAAHVAANRDPLRRYALHLSGDDDYTIVHPGKISAERSAEICGQCHSLFAHRKDPLSGSPEASGARFHAGQDLDQVIEVIARPEDPEHPLLKKPELRDKIEHSFWADGQMRMAGRDFNGLRDSPCFRGGEFSCLSCHSMHQSDPDDQLARGMEGDEACLQCHEDQRGALEAHTHHEAGSAGSRCYNCHMPYTSWGLLKTIRSHTVTSPSIAESLDPVGRPNACNLCHLDRTLSWTERTLEKWYEKPQADVPEGELRERSAALVWLMRGDAGQRSLIAASMGWEPALQASGRDWVAPFLGVGLTDEYSAVRFVAHRSLTRLPGFEGVDFDYLAPLEERMQVVGRVMQTWSQRSRPSSGAGRALFLDGAWELEGAALQELRARRDNRRILIAE